MAKVLVAAKQTARMHIYFDAVRVMMRKILILHLFHPSKEEKNAL
jgi:hypothetical protein